MGKCGMGENYLISYWKSKSTGNPNLLKNSQIQGIQRIAYIGPQVIVSFRSITILRWSTVF